MNTLINNIYWNVWTKLAAVDPREEDGAEAVEWIAMVAILMIVLFAINNIFGSESTTWAQSIADGITAWIETFTTGNAN